MKDQIPIYAIGDIHGRHDLLDNLLDLVRDDARSTRHRLVFLGDYVNRGAGSKYVIEKLFLLSLKAYDTPVFLRGNHDDALWRVMTEDTPDLTRQWLQNRSNGATSTLRSYDIAAPILTDLESIKAIPMQMREAMPGGHKIFFDRLQDKLETPDYFFSHAGIDPSKPLDKQDRHALVQGNADFLSIRHFEKTIVHGHWHTRNYMPEIRGNRIGIDTGAEIAGNLTAVRLEPGQPPRFLMTCAY